MATSSEDLKQAIRDRLDVFNEGDLDRFEEFIAPRAVSSFPAQPQLNRDKFRNLLVGFRSAFPDIAMTARPFSGHVGDPAAAAEALNAEQPKEVRPAAEAA